MGRSGKLALGRRRWDRKCSQFAERTDGDRDGGGRDAAELSMGCYARSGRNAKNDGVEKNVEGNVSQGRGLPKDLVMGTRVSGMVRRGRKENDSVDDDSFDDGSNGGNIIPAGENESLGVTSGGSTGQAIESSSRHN